MRVLNEEETAAYVADMMRGSHAIFQAWKTEWVAKVFPTLLARSKWNKKHSNIKIDTVGLLQYEAKYAADTWKLARVVSTYPDEQGLVRTLEVQLGIAAGQHGGPEHQLQIPVQRFCPQFDDVSEPPSRCQTASTSAQQAVHSSC